jgi:DNA-binding LacI/PurR family transcriptional regulator
MATTIYDVARQAGVSPATVSRVFNRRPNVSESVREAVFETARKLGYAPQQSASRDCFAIVMEPDTNPGLTGYQELLLRSLNRQAYALGHRIELVALSDMPTLSTRTYRGVIGTIYTPDDVRTFARISRTLSARSVLINSQARGLSSVCSDEKAGMELALDALVAKGHRVVAHVGHHNGAWCSDERAAALDRLSADRGVRVSHIDVREENVLEGVTAALDPSVTALLVTGEGLGHRVLHLLRKLRLQPGTDVSVLAHEMPGISEFCAPPLTTIEQDFDQLTATALELLGSDRVRKRLVDYRFHERDSVMTPQLTASAPARRV